MTFQEMQQLLGEATTNKLTEMVLVLNQATDTQTDPTVHNRALREFLSTLLAITVVSAPDATPGADTVTQTSGRFEEIVRKMYELRNDPSFTPPLLN